VTIARCETELLRETFAPHLGMEIVEIPDASINQFLEADS